MLIFNKTIFRMPQFSCWFYFSSLEFLDNFPAFVSHLVAHLQSLLSSGALHQLCGRHEVQAQNYIRFHIIHSSPVVIRAASAAWFSDWSYHLAPNADHLDHSDLYWCRSVGMTLSLWADHWLCCISRYYCPSSPPLIPMSLLPAVCQSSSPIFHHLRIITHR